MHFNDNFALVALIVFAAIGLVSSANANGLNLNDSAAGNYTDSGTWTPPGDPDDGLADTITIDSHTVTISGAGQASNDTVTVSAGGTLTTAALSDVLKGATIVLNGGTLLKPWQLTVDLGGDIEVAADSVFSGSRYVSYNDSLDFTAASSLTITNAQTSDAWNAVFRAFTVTNNATLDLRHAVQFWPLTVTVTNVTIGAANTLTVTGASASKLTITGTNPGCQGQLTLASGFGGVVEANGSNVLGSATININGGTLRAMVADALVSKTVYVNSGGILSKKANGLEHAYRGTTIILNGGTLEAIPGQSDWGTDSGGNVSVVANSTISAWRQQTTLDSLDFDAPSTLTCVDNHGDPTVLVFRNLTATNNGTFSFTAVGAVTISATNSIIGVTNTVTVTGAGTSGKVQINGPVSPRLTGSADLLTGTSFTLIDWQSGTLDYTASASLDTAGGLWSGSIPADNNDLTVTLANNKGDLNVRDAQSFASEDGGHVVLKNLVAGTEYLVHLDLASADANKAAVQTEMQKNPLWAEVGDSNQGGYELQALFVATGSGDFRFAWDNSAAGRLGDNLLGVKLTVPPTGTVIFFR